MRICGRCPDATTMALVSLRVAMLRLGWRDIKGRAAVEEAIGPELEAQAGYGHHGPVFEARDMVFAHHIPDHHVGVLNRAICRRPRWQPRATGVLIGIVPGRILLIGMIGCHPEMLGHKV